MEGGTLGPVPEPGPVPGPGTGPGTGPVPGPGTGPGTGPVPGPGTGTEPVSEPGPGPGTGPGPHLGDQAGDLLVMVRAQLQVVQQVLIAATLHPQSETNISPKPGLLVDTTG